MLFLYRPRETWMPFRVPRNVTQQRAYNRQMQERFDQTRAARTCDTDADCGATRPDQPR